MDILLAVKSGGSPINLKDMILKSGTRDRLQNDIEKGYDVVIFVDQSFDISYLDQFSYNRMVHAIKLINLPIIVLCPPRIITIPCRIYPCGDIYNP